MQAGNIWSCAAVSPSVGCPTLDRVSRPQARPRTRRSGALWSLRDSTRRNIKKAEKEGVEITVSDTMDAVAAFCDFIGSRGNIMASATALQVLSRYP